MDDYLDQDLDRIEGKYTLSMFLDKAILPYTLLCTVMCMALAPILSGSLFLASYLIGMGHDLKRPLPFGWTAWQEALLFGTFGFLVFGGRMMLSSLLIILFIQLADDLVDFYTDAKYSRRNFAVRFGFKEILFAGSLTLAGSIVLDVQKTIMVCLSTPLVLLAVGYGKRLIKDD